METKERVRGPARRAPVESRSTVAEVQPRSRMRLARHLVGMFVAMCLGMAIGPFLFSLALGTSADDALRDHPIGFVLVMGTSMTAPMVGWMLHLGHSRRSSAEMAIVMAAPAVPLICLKLGGVISGPVCGVYCIAATLAMIALIVYRRDDYRDAARAHA